MNAAQVWKILRDKGVKHARPNDRLFYGKGAMVKKASPGWLVVPCGATLFDLEKVMREARADIRAALEENNINFEESPEGFLLDHNAEVAELADAQG